MVAALARPESVAEVAEAVRASSRLFVVGRDAHRDWRLDEAGDSAVLDLGALRGVVDIQPADQVAIVRAGSRVSEVQAELNARNQSLPYAPFETDDDPTIGGALSLALPHRLEGACGTWRDWVLGMTVVRADGAIAKCGSCAVKNVAGYDVGRLFIGARGALGVIVEVILKTYPLRALPEPPAPRLSAPKGPRWVQRAPLGSAGRLSGGAVDRETGTLWAAVGADDELPRIEGDWVVRSGRGRQNLGVLPQPELFGRAKTVFDPLAKLNPGAFGE
ncbi:MAG TPA: FAD-binding oxidoreductase [Fimbriimonadaceae bacterium]|nr:FAD-binding oxidoreductase [Fimbriimonadaceae bacterium]